MSRRTYYKVVRLDGTDFRTGTVQWAPPEGHDGEWIVTHPTHTLRDARQDFAGTYLSVAIEASDCTGMRWPCRLLTVEPRSAIRRTDIDSKRAGWQFAVTGELPAHEVFGPQGAEVVAIIDRARRLIPAEFERMAAAWNAAQGAAWDAAWDAAQVAARAAARAAARNAARNAARGAAGAAAGAAAWNAAGATVVRDLITPDHHALLTAPWMTAISHEDGAR